jgi:hypothetical protein
MLESLEVRQLLSASLTDQDIGFPSATGSASYDTPSDTYTVTGGGNGIGGTSDQFNFDSATMTGNGTVAAYLNSLTNSNIFSQAGIMIRGDSTAASPFAAVLYSPSVGLEFEWRTASGASALQNFASGTSAPVSLKLSRSGNTFTAYYSTNGTTWNQIGSSENIIMASNTLGGLAVSSNTASLTTGSFSSVGVGTSLSPAAGIYSSSQQTFLNNLEEAEVMFFYDESNATTGLTPDYANANGGGASADASIASIGFDLTALTIGDSRGWLTDSQAYTRALTTINFLYNHGANENGFFYHFLNETTGARYGTSEVSSVDTAELMAGVLTVAQYWAGTPLQTTAMQMFDRVDWPWMQQSSGIFYGAWTPESGFSGGYGDYSEASLLYLISLGSPTYPTTQASWNAWSRTPVENYAGYTYVDADDNALFTEQYPQAWFNLQGLTDSKGLNYYTNSQSATLAQRQYMINLSSTYSDYGPNMWGLTPAEGGGSSYTNGTNTYTIWGGPPANVPLDGTVVPTGPGGSLEFEPELGVQALQYMATTYPSEYQKYGLVDSFDPLKNWSSTLVLGIDVGMTLISAENSRSDSVWNTFMQNPVAQQAMAKAFPGSNAVWQVGGSGNWNTAANWTDGKIPNSTGAEADFYGAIAAAHTVYSDIAVTAGILHFNNTTEYVIAGAGSLTLQAAGSNSALVEVDQGTDEINLPLTLANNTTFNIATGATLIIADPLTLAGGVTLTNTGGGSLIIESTISLAAGASINLQNNSLIIPDDSGNEPAIAADIASSEITSSAISASPAAVAIGSYDDGTQTLLRATWIGDANCDGIINADDLSLMMLGQARQQTTWSAGDFNHDGKITADDWAEFAYGVAVSHGQPYIPSIVPTAPASASQLTSLLAYPASSLL